MKVINQSLIKDLLFKLSPKEYCPRLIHSKYFLRMDCIVSSDAMLKGRYFEYLVFGGTPVKLPTKRNGEKKIDQIRIEEQATIAKQMLPKYLMQVYPGYNTQVRIRKVFEGAIIEGTLDLFPTLFLVDSSLRLAIIDLKSTADINSTFGEFAWGKYDVMDWIQGAMYHELIRDIDWDLNSHINPITRQLIEHFKWYIDNDEVTFFYWVFGIKEPLENKFFEVVWDYPKQKYLHESIQKALAELDYAQSKGWREVPSNYCKSCLLDCKSRQMIEKS